MEAEDGFADRLQLALGELSARQLAHKAGIAQNSVGKYLRRESEPTMRALVAMARALNVEIKWLATGEGPVHPPVSADPEAGPIDENALIADRLSRMTQENIALLGAIPAEVDAFHAKYGRNFEPQDRGEYMAMMIVEALIHTLQYDFPFDVRAELAAQQRRVAKALARDEARAGPPAAPIRPGQARQKRA